MYTSVHHKYYTYKYPKNKIRAIIMSLEGKCEWCGRNFAYLKQHQFICKSRPADADTPAANNPPEDEPKVEKKEVKKVQADTRSPKADEDFDLLKPDDPEDEDVEVEPEAEDIPWVFIIPVIIIVAFAAAALLFRDKIREFLRRGKPPAYGVPNYAG